MRERKAGLGPAFGNLFTSNLASSLGDGIARTAAPLLAVRLTDDPLLVSGIAALAMLPWLLFAVPAGIIIDRIDRRTALALANGGRAILAGGLLALAATDALTIWWLYVAIFLYGIGETVYDGAIRAVVPSIVARPNLPRANSRIEAGELIVQNFLSGPFTSILFAVSILIPLGANVVVYAGAVVLAVLLPRSAAGTHLGATGSAPRTAWHRQFADGFRFIFASRMLTTLLGLSTFIGLCYSASTASFVLYLLDRLELPEAFFGLFLLTGAIGGILGTLIAQRLKDLWGAGTAMAVANVVSTSAFLFIGLVPTLWAAAVGYFVTSAAVLVWNVHVMSLRQSVIPSRLLGRVHGSWRTVLWGSMPLGSLIGGALGRVDLAVPFIVGGGVATVAALVFFRFLRTLPNPEDIDNGDPPHPAPTTPLKVLLPIEGYRSP